MNPERPYSSASLEEFAILERDPIVERIKNKALELAGVVNECGASIEELNDLVSSLDEMWPFTGEEVTVTGSIALVNPPEGIRKQQFVEDSSATSNGLTFAPEPIMLDDEIIAVRYVPAFHFYIPIEHEGRTYRLPASAKFDEITFENSLPQTKELVEQRLRHFHPEIIEEVDVRIFNTKGDETDATRELVDFYLNIDASSEDDIRMLVDLQTYLTKAIPYEDELPYIINAYNRVFIETDDGMARVLGKGTQVMGFFRPERIQFMPTEDDEAVYEPTVCGKLYGDKPGVSAEILVPINRLDRFSSIR